MKEEVKGLYAAILLSAIAILAVNWIWPAQEVATEEKPVAEIKAEVEGQEIKNSDDALYSPSNRKVEDVAVVLKNDRRVNLKNDKISGSIRVKGARFDSVYLNKYKKTLDENSSDVELLAPAGTLNPYYAEFGWLATDKSVKTPDSNTQWKVIGKDLTPETPVTLEWNNGAGVKFVRRISLDKDYMFNIEQIVENNSGKDIKLYPYGMVNKVYTLDSNSAIVHEGMLGVVDGSLKEFKSKDLDEGENEEFESQGGWAGFGERYWFSAFTLSNSSKSNVRFTRTAKDTYQIDFVGSAVD
ncbi:MAG: membrane protein insertase YidC, partial [Alphaproteobacteria bacterium]|nr:membrane protein insertase YidC [Alphaproteobacteria bacterium]